MKKIISTILVMMLVFLMSQTVFATEVDGNESTTPTEPRTTGSITINNAVDGNVYEIYRMLELTSFTKNEKEENYSYKVCGEWKAFFSSAEAKKYISLDETGNYVNKWIASDSETVYATFAKMAFEYVESVNKDDNPDNNIYPTKSSNNAGEMESGLNSEGKKTGKFDELPLGWYLVDSTAGALCGLTTTDYDASINAKNHVPTIDKQVQEDATGIWGDVNTADIGQMVDFLVSIDVAAGAQNYILHDIMSSNFTFEQDTTPDEKDMYEKGIKEIVIFKTETEAEESGDGTDPGENVAEAIPEGEHVHTSSYIIKTGQQHKDEDGKVVSTCTFEIEFTKEFMETLKPNDRIVIYYNAMLNRNAEIGPDGKNINEAYLEFGENHYTEEDTTNTHTFSIDIVKTNSSNMLLDGAKFRIYDAFTGGNEIGVVPLMQSDNKTPVLDNNKNIMYRRARTDETGATLVDIVVKGGKATVVGLDNGVYYLEEVVAPNGYNPLTTRIKFTIANDNLHATFNENIYSSGSGVHVVNKTGNMLPETGAAGKMMFITCGMFVVLGAGVLLVTKKRMAMIVD